MEPVTYVRKRLSGAQVIDLHIIRAAGLHDAAVAVLFGLHLF
jgi:hypothetical protein